MDICENYYHSDTSVLELFEKQNNCPSLMTPVK